MDEKKAKKQQQLPSPNRSLNAKEDEIVSVPFIVSDAMVPE